MAKAAVLEAPKHETQSEVEVDKPKLDTFTVTLPVGSVYCETNQRYYGLMLGPGKIRFNVLAEDQENLREILNELFQGLAERAALRVRTRKALAQDPTARPPRKVRTDRKKSGA